MTDGSTVDRDARLAELADAIKAHRLAMQGNARDMILEAVAVGKALIEAKNLVRHGEWLPYVERTCSVGARMAQHYLRLAREAEKSETRFAFDGESIRGAIQRLRVKQPRRVMADTVEEQEEAFEERRIQAIPVVELGPLRALID